MAAKENRTANGVIETPTTQSEATIENGDKSSIPEREQWGSKWEFIFSCVGASVGLGNIWRFPYLAFENGGGAFLFPYFLLLLVIGKPMYLMECALGQFAQSSPLTSWRFSPAGQGVGYAMILISLIVAIYYNVIIGYCFFYMFAGFTSQLPWETCDPAWADMDVCYVRSQNTTCRAEKCEPSTEQYWKRYVLGMHKASLSYQQELVNGTMVNRTYAFPDPGNIGEIKWDLCLCVLLAWMLVFACLFNGIKTSGKVVYFTASFPYVILLILFVRGLLLEGASEGVWYFFVPEWEKLKEISVWRKAAEQMFFSLGVSWGGMIMFGSYNDFRNPVHSHAFAISLLDFATSIIAGVVVFSILGELKLQLGVASIKDVVQSGQGLAFIAYPEAVSLLAVSPLWSFLFFFMLLLLGLDSEFALLETVLSGIYDLFPKTRRHKKWITLALCCCLFLISLPVCTYSGQFVFDLMDTYGGGIAVFWVAIFETFIIMWVYGVQEFADDISFMVNATIGWYWRICWAVIPLLLTIIFGISIYFWTQPSYGGVVFYPDWAHGVGWFLTILVAIQIPLVAVIVIIYHACKGQVSDAFKPSKGWGPQDEVTRQEWLDFKAENRAKVRKQLSWVVNKFRFHKKLDLNESKLNHAYYNVTMTSLQPDDDVTMRYRRDYNDNGVSSHM